jgi:predicted RNA binding protein YcfA (HicA-like mRNA interferase family)
MKSCDNPRDLERFASEKGLKRIRTSGGHGLWSNGKGRPVPIPTHGAIGGDLQKRIIKQILALVATACAAGAFILWNFCPPGLYEIYLTMVH